MILQLLQCMLVCVSVWEGSWGWGWGVAGGWMPLPTRLQQYCDLASLVLLFQHLWAVIALLRLPKCMVSFFITAPAHEHVTWVAVNPALFSFHNTRTSSVQDFFFVCFVWVNLFIFSRLTLKKTRSFRAKSLIFIKNRSLGSHSFGPPVLIF